MCYLSRQWKKTKKKQQKKQRLKKKFQLALFCRASHEHFVLIILESNHTYNKKFAMAFVLVTYNCMQVF